MKKVKEFIKYKESVKPEFKRVLAVIFFTFIYGLGVQWFLEASAFPLFTGGIPGVAQVLRDIFFRGANQAEAGRMFMSIFIIVINVPILILGWFGVSKKFTMYSLISVIIQSAVIGFIPHFELGLGGVEHALLASILGGLLIGVGIGGALKYGTSTGGFDIIAQYWSLKHGHSVGFISMALNIAIAVAGALVSKNPNVAAGVIFSYTVIRIIITTVATDKVHTSYHFLAIDIITENPKEMIDSILHQLGRGVTLSKVEGAYSTHEKTQIMCVISTYELQQMTAIINHVDDKAFVIAKPVKSVIGNFTKKRIA